MFRSVNGVDGARALQCVDCAAVFESVSVSTRRAPKARKPVTRADSPFDLDGSLPAEDIERAVDSAGQPAASGPRVHGRAYDPDVHERETARPPASAPRNTPAPRAPNVSGSFQLAHVTPRRLFSTG